MRILLSWIWVAVVWLTSGAGAEPAGAEPVQAVDDRTDGIGQRTGSFQSIESVLRSQEALISSTSDSSTRITMRLELARMLLQDQRRSSARRVLNDIRTEEQLSEQSLLVIASLLEQCGAWTDASECLERLRSGTTDQRARQKFSRQLAQIFSRSGQSDSAIRELRLLLDELQPGSIPHLELMDELMILIEQQDGEAAVESEFVQLLQRYPDVAVLCTRLANHLLRISPPADPAPLERAIGYVKQAVELNADARNSAETVNNQILLGTLHWKLGRKDQAKAVWEQIAVDHREDLRVMQQVSEVYREVGAAVDEARWLARICELNPPVSLRLRCARQLVESQQLDEAIRQFRTCIRLEQSRSTRNSLRNEIAGLLVRSERIDGELSRLFKSVRELRNAETDESRMMWLEIAALQKQAGLFSEVVTSAKDALPNAGSLADDWLFIADDLVAAQQSAVALDVLREWNKVSNSRVGRIRLAGLHFDQDQYPEAIEQYRELLRTSPSRQDELQQIERLAILAHQISDLDAHLTYLEGRQQNSGNRLELTVNRVTTFVAIGAPDRAVSELQSLADSTEFLNLSENPGLSARGENPGLSARGELTRIAALAEQLASIDVAVRLYEVLERGNPTKQPKMLRSLQLRAQHASADELIRYLQDSVSGDDSSQKCCELIDELFRIDRVSTAVQLLPTLTVMPTDDPGFTIRLMALHRLAGHDSAASVLLESLLSKYLARDDYSSFALEITPSDLTAVQSARRFNHWLSTCSFWQHESPQSRQPFTGFPKTMREIDYCVLATAMKQVDTLPAFMSRKRQMVDGYLLRREIDHLDTVTFGLSAFLDSTLTQSLINEASQFAALMMNDGLSIAATDPNADLSLLIPALRSLIGCGLLNDETLWLPSPLAGDGPSEGNLKPLIAACGVLGAEIPLNLQRGMKQQAAAETQQADSVGSLISLVNPSSLMAMALEQERQGNSSAACDLYLKVLKEHRREFIVEFETLLQGFESARREGDLAAALLHGELKDFSDVADAVLFLSIRVSRQEKDREVGDRLFLKLTEVFPLQRLRFLVAGHQSRILSDEEFVAKVMEELNGLQELVSGKTEFDRPLGSPFPGADLIMRLSPAVMEDLWLQSGFTQAMQQMSGPQAALLVPQIREFVNARPDFRTGPILVALFEQLADESKSTVASLTQGSDQLESWQDVAAAAHLEVVMRQRRPIAGMLRLRRQTLMSIINSTAASNSMKNWAALRLVDVLLALEEREACLLLLQSQRNQRLATINVRSSALSPATTPATTTPATMTPGEQTAIRLIEDRLSRFED